MSVHIVNAIFKRLFKNCIQAKISKEIFNRIISEKKIFARKIIKWYLINNRKMNL